MTSSTRVSSIKGTCDSMSHDSASRFPGRVGLPYHCLRLDSHSHSSPSTLQRSVGWIFNEKKKKPIEATSKRGWPLTKGFFSVFWCVRRRTQDSILRATDRKLLEIEDWSFELTYVWNFLVRLMS